MQSEHNLWNYVVHTKHMQTSVIESPHPLSEVTIFHADDAIRGVDIVFTLSRCMWTYGYGRTDTGPQQRSQRRIALRGKTRSATSLKVNQGHQTVAFHMFCIFFSCAIVTLSFRGVVFTIFDFKMYLEIRVSGHSRSLNVIERGTMLYTRYGFLLVFYRNLVPNTHRF